MKILTFDTSLNKTYITFGEDDKIIVSKEICSDGEKFHSAYLVLEIISILKSQNLTMQEIDAAGVNIGPGSFTGIRICTVIARVAAQQTGMKVVPVPSLEILAKINNTDKNSLVLLDARKQKAYTAQYDCRGKQISPPQTVNYDEIKQIADDEKFVIITDKAMSKLLAEREIASINYEESNYPLGKYLYEITRDKLKSGDDFYWAKVKPLYIQPPSITMPKKAGA